MAFLEWAQANLATLLVGGAVAVLAAAAVFFLWKNRKKGGCSSGCGACPMAGECHRAKKQDSPSKKS